MPVMLTFSRLSARIDEPNHAILEEVVRALRERTDIRIVRVEGHSSYCRDELGNTAISEERAAHIASLLVEMGIPTAAIATVGYGTSQPNGSECDSPTIRRVEFSLLVCR